jgi:hypothetical protein
MAVHLRGRSVLLALVAIAILAQGGQAQAAGSFAPAGTFPLGERPSDVVAGRFDAGPTTDLVIALPDSSRVALLPGNGDGTFGLPAPSPAITPRSLRAVRIVGGRRLDLVTADGVGNSVSVLRGTGGAFVRSTIPVGDFVSDAAVGDLNGDGRRDIVYTAGDRVGVLRNRGGGRFRRPITFSSGGQAGGIEAVKLGRDDRTDVVVTHGFPGTLSVLRGRPGGRLGPPRTYDLSGGAQQIAVSDFDADGLSDLAVSRYGDSGVTILKGIESRRPTFTETFPTNGGSLGLSLADFNLDGRLDIAVTAAFANTVDVLIARRDGRFRPAAHYPTGDFPQGVAAGRFDRGRSPDLAVVNFTGSSYQVLLNR